MPASLTLLRAVGGAQGARLFTGGPRLLWPLKTAPRKGIALIRGTRVARMMYRNLVIYGTVKYSSHSELRSPVMSTSRPQHVENVGTAQKLGNLVKKLGLEPSSLIEVYAYDYIHHVCARCYQ